MRSRIAELETSRLHTDRGVNVDGETVAGGEEIELMDAGLGVAAKAEVAAFMEAAQVKRVDQYLLDKIFGGQSGERGVKGQHQHRVDAGAREQAEALAEGREQARRLGGAEKLLGMRIKGDGYGLRILRARFGGDGGENLLVA